MVNERELERELEKLEDEADRIFDRYRSAKNQFEISLVDKRRNIINQRIMEIRGQLGLQQWGT